MTTTDQAITDAKLYIRQGILGARWPDGTRFDHITSKTADLIAQHIADGPLTVLVLTENERELLFEGVLRDATDGMFDDDDLPAVESLVERLRAAVSS